MSAMRAAPARPAAGTTRTHRTSEPAPRAGESGYRPELDGIRAVACTLVIAFHAGMAKVVGGYIGVDVFFVLSGFLITGLLLTAGDGGAVGLITFYGRRARRLLPLALVVLVVTAVAWLAVAGSIERDPLIGDIRSAALYFSNWHFASQATDYFASNDAPSPFVHFWSLSAEEQFYLVWPALLALCYVAARGSKRRAAWIVGTLAGVLMVASLASLALTTRHGAPSYAYFATHNRAYQLLAGAVLAVWAHRRRARRLRAGEPAVGVSGGYAADFAAHSEEYGAHARAANGNGAGNGLAQPHPGRHAGLTHAGTTYPAQAHPAESHVTQARVTGRAGGVVAGTYPAEPHAFTDHAAAAHAASLHAASPHAAGAHAAGAHAAGRHAGGVALEGVSASDERARTGTLVWVLLGAVQLLAVAGLVYAASSQTTLGPGARGALSAAITLILLASLELVPTAPGGWLLSRPTWAYLGRISYGAYLWHWPVILLIRRFAVMLPWQLFVVAGLLSVALAGLTHRLFEDPIRRSRALARRPRSTVLAGVAFSVVVALVVGPQLLGADRRPAVLPVTEAGAVLPQTGTGGQGSSSPTAPKQNVPPVNTRTPAPGKQALQDAGRPSVHDCERKIPEAGVACLDHTGSPGSPTVLVIGDSHLEAFFQPLDELAKEHDFTLYTWMYYVCPWEQGVYPVDSPQQQNERPCRDRKGQMEQFMLEKIKPDVVVAMNRGYEDPNQPRGLKLDGQPGLTDPGQVLAKSVPAAAQYILTYAKKLVIVEPWPSLTINQRSCLSKLPYIEQCRASASRGKLPSEVAYEQLAARDQRVRTVDLDKVMCPKLPVCDAVVDGVITRRDQDHLSVPWALHIKPQLATELQRVGVFA